MEIVVLGVPEKVDDLEVKLTKVDVEHRQLGAYVLLTGVVTWDWDDDDLPKGAEVDHYNVRIGEATSQQVSNVTISTKGARVVVLSREIGLSPWTKQIFSFQKTSVKTLSLM